MSPVCIVADDDDGGAPANATASRSGLDRTEAVAAACKWLRRVLWLALFWLSVLGFTIQAFFAPTAARDYHMSHAQIGYVFGAFSIGYIAVSLLMSSCDAYNRWSTRRLGVAILLLVASSACVAALFGLTPWFLNAASVTSERRADVSAQLTGLLALWRALLGGQVAIMDVFVLLYVLRLYPDDVASVIGEWQGVMGLGVVVGPPLGGYLFDLLGFAAPQLCIGGMTLLVAMAALVMTSPSCVLRLLGSSGQQDAVLALFTAVSIKPPVTFRSAWRYVTSFNAAWALGPILLMGLAVSVFTFCESMGPLMLTQFYGLTPTVIGLCLTGAAITYAIVAWAIGTALNRASVAWAAAALCVGVVVMACGLFALPCAWSFYAIAPPLDSMDSRKALSITAMAALGGGLALCAVTSGVLTMAVAKAYQRLPFATTGAQSSTERQLAGGDDATNEKRSLLSQSETPSPRDSGVVQHHEDMVPVAGALANLAQSVGGVLGPVAGAHLLQATGWYRTVGSVALALFALTLLYAVVALRQMISPSGSSRLVLLAAVGEEASSPGRSDHGADRTCDERHGTAERRLIRSAERISIQ